MPFSEAGYRLLKSGVGADRSDSEAAMLLARMLFVYVTLNQACVIICWRSGIFGPYEACSRQALTRDVATAAASARVFMNCLPQPLVCIERTM